MASATSPGRLARRHSGLLARPRLWAVLALLAILAALFPIVGMRTAGAAANLTVRVYTDTSRDGVYSGEPGIGDVEVKVYNEDGFLAGLNRTSTLPGDLGLVSFNTLPAGSYRIEVINPADKLANGTVISLPGSATPGQENSLVSFVTIGSTDIALNVGLRPLDATRSDPSWPSPTRTIVSRVWNDRDADGLQDAGEPGIPGLTLRLYDGANAQQATAVSGPDGTYRFVDNVPSGSNYYIQIDSALPPGFVLTKALVAPADDARDSDASLVAGKPRVGVPTVPVTTRGINDDSLDFGLTQGGVSGFVWRDLDRNGLIDPGEEYLNNITVELWNGATKVDETTTRQLSGDPRGGFFEFVDVPNPGSYTVRIPAGMFDQPTDALYGHATPANAVGGDRGLVNGTGDVQVVTVGSTLEAPATISAGSARDETPLFGLYAGTVGDFIWHDVDRSGTVTGAEATLGLGGVDVFVDLDGDCVADPGEPTTTSGVNGIYLFDNLPLGNAYDIVLDAANFAPGGVLEGRGTTTGAACGAGAVRITTSSLNAGAPEFLGADFGIVRAEVGNFVWHDVDGNGVYGLTESGVPNVTVRLYGPGADATFFTPDDDLAGTQTTSASGLYTITDLLAGSYYAAFDLSDPALSAYVASTRTPAGWLDVDPTGTSQLNDVRAQVSPRVWRTPTFSITPGSLNPGIDAAIFQPTTLSGRVFFDQNRNDQDETPTPEPGLAQFPVVLRRASDDAVIMTRWTTLPDGAYSFAGVAPGQYVVRVGRPVGQDTNWAFVAQGVPAALDVLASDVDSSGRTGSIDVLSGTPVSDIDAGLVGQNTLLGRVFYDRDGSHTQTGADTELDSSTATVQVQVATANLSTTYTVISTTLAANPGYRFDELPGGSSGVTYTLSFAPPAAGFVAATPDVGDDSLDSDGPNLTISGAAVGQGNILDRDQGYTRPVTISARIFDEVTGLPPDNVYAGGDGNIPSATATLTTSTGFSTGSFAGPDATGLITFTVVPTTTVGGYWVNVPLPTGFTRSPGTPPNTGAATAGNPLADATVGPLSFGHYRAAALSGSVRFDRDADDDLLLPGDDEPGVQGVTVTLRLGATPVLTTTTAADGSYSFPSVLPANSYSLRFHNPDAPNFAFVDGPGGDNDVSALVVDDGETASFDLAPAGSATFDAALRGRARVQGQVWFDRDGDGLRGAGEDAAELPPVTTTVTVTVNIPNRLSTTVVSTTTTAGGLYLLQGLPGGSGSQATFDLSFATPAGWAVAPADQGSQPSGTDSDGAGTGADQRDDQPLGKGATESRDQGYLGARIVARVFDEVTNLPPDNAYSLGDAGILTATATLTTSTGFSSSTFSGPDATGLITFTVAPTTTVGGYWLSVPAPAGFTRSPGNTGISNPGSPLGGQTVGPIAFGHYRPGTVSGSVRFDRDADDTLFTDAEPGVEGVVVTLRLGSTPVYTTTTSAAGDFSLAGVAPGSYTLRFANPEPAGFSFVAGPAGDNDVTTLAGSDGEIASLSVAPGGTLTRDAALRGTASLSGRLWVDGNADGLQNPTETTDLTASTSVTATLTVAIPNRLSTSYTLAATTTSGSYSFTQLPGGSGSQVTFDLAFSTPTGWSVSPADQGSQPSGTDSDGAGTGADQLDDQPLSAGASADRDQGYYRPVQIVARVFDELTNLPPDNAYSLGDAGILTATATLTTSTGFSSSTFSGPDATGLITFTVAPTTTVGGYWLSVPAPAGFTRSPGNSGVRQVTPNPTSGDTTATFDFGHFRGGTVSGSVRFDRDADDTLFADAEPGVEGVTVTLRLGSTPVYTTTTSAAGDFSLAGVAPGSYTLRFANPEPAGFSFVAGPAGDNDVTTLAGSDGEIASLSVTPGGTLTRDAALRGTASLSGRLWVDGNADGLQNPSETTDLTASTSVTATLTVAIPNRLSTSYTLAATTTSGSYSFTQLPGGSGSQVTFDLAFSTPTGWSVSPADQGSQPSGTDSDGAGTGADQLDDQPLSAGASADRDQGYYRPVQIVARVFDELTNLPPDNAYSLGDAGILTATATLTTSTGFSSSTFSGPDATGLITFTVAPTTTVGGYWLSVPAPAGFTRSPGNSGVRQVTPNPTSGDTTATFDFGHYQPGSVTGRVLFDRDADDDLLLPGDDEPGVEGVTVRLVDPSGNLTGLSDLTDATGTYTITGAPAGSGYRVEVVSPDTLNFTVADGPNGDNDVETITPGGTTGRTKSFTITAGASVGGGNIALRGESTVSGVVWVDIDGDGIRDASESASGLPAVTATVTVAINIPNRLTTTVVSATTTLADGSFALRGLPGGTSAAEAQFDLGFSAPAGWGVTLADQGADPASDSDGAGAGPDQLDDQALGRGVTASRDRGYLGVTIVARVFEERRVPVDNAFDGAGDVGVTAATLAVSDGGTPVTPLNTPAIDPTTGLVSISLPPTAGSYTLSVTPPAGLNASPGNASSQAGIGGGSGRYPASGEYLFGYYQNGSVAGTAWFDADGDGVREPGELPLQGVTVELYADTNATIGDGETTVGPATTTDASGAYSFASVPPSGVPAGTRYRARFVLPADYAFTQRVGAVDVDDNSDADPAAGATLGYTGMFDIGSNENVTYVDAGAVGTLSLSGTAWSDLDSDGALDGGEPGLAGVTLTLTVTTSINSTSPQVTAITTTVGTAVPNFTFDALPPGSYEVSATGLPLGYALSTPATLSGASLPASAQDFGLYRVAAIGDRVWLDRDGDGLYNPAADVGYPGVTVNLVYSATGTISATTTSAAAGDIGSYRFDDVRPGDYRVEFVLPAGVQPVNDGLGGLTTDNDNDARLSGQTAPFSVASGDVLAGVDAGLTGTASIGGVAWEDLDDNDVRDAGDTTRLEGVAVTLTFTPTGWLAPLTLTDTTAGDGSYGFGALPPGGYQVAFTAPAGYSPVRALQGGDPSRDSDAPIATGTLGAGQALATVDAGYRRAGLRAYLPIVHGQPERPDLTVSFSLAPDKAFYSTEEPVQINVVVTNVGNGPTDIGFWVDLYINPSVAPTTPNVRWDVVCGLQPCFGIAWYVDRALQPGESITLTSTPSSYTVPATRWPGRFASGTTDLYVYVDSYNPPVPWGAVDEANEANNRAERHGLSVTGQLAGTSGAAAPLPARQLPSRVRAQ